LKNLLKNKKLTSSEILSLLEETEMKSAKYKVGLLEGVSDPDGFQMDRRAITQAEINDLKAAGIPAAENMNVGDMQYFKTKSTEKQKVKSGGGSSGNTTTETERQVAGWKKAIKKGNYALFTGGGKKIPGEDNAYLVYRDGNFYRADKLGNKQGSSLTSEQAASIL